MPAVVVTATLGGRAHTARWDDGSTSGSEELLQEARANVGAEVRLGSPAGVLVRASLDNLWGFVAACAVSAGVTGVELEGAEDIRRAPPGTLQ